MYSDSVSTVILNYNNYKDTLFLLNQLLVQQDRYGVIIIVDNDSTDSSGERIEAFLFKLQIKGKGKFNYGGREISFNEYEQNVVFIKSPFNGGFAYGNNLGIYFSLKNTESKYFLILNNDIKITNSFYKTMLSFASLNNEHGLWGSILYLDRDGHKNEIQGIGGVFNTFTGRSKHIGLFETSLDRINTYNIQKLDYPIGACLLICRETVNIVGLLSEDYFLYFEELDYVYRMRKHGLTFSVCLDSKIYHKCGASIEKDKDEKGVSKMSQYYLNRSRYIFMKKYHPYKYFLFIFIDVLAKLKKKMGG